MTYQLGVDLGTTFTAAAIARGGRVEPVTLGANSVAVPSVVHLDGDAFMVGDPAQRRAATDPLKVAREFKRRLGDPTPIMVGGAPMAADLLMARLLDWVVQQVTAAEGGPPDHLVVTHPANWRQYKLDLLDQAVRHVGLPPPQLLPEPVAAATFYASQRDLAPGSVVAVYDLGGGTFDAAVVRSTQEGFEIIGRPEGIERLGGIDFDHAVLRYASEVAGLDLEAMGDPGAGQADDPALIASMAQLRLECVNAKEALSAETDVSIPVMVPDRYTEVRLTRSELEAMIQPSLGESVVALRRAIQSAELTPDDVSAVLLVGGSSRIPLVGQLVAAELGRPIAVDARPKDAICLGAALSATGPEPPAAEGTESVPAALAASSGSEVPQDDTGLSEGEWSSQRIRSRRPLFAAAAIAAVAALVGLGMWLSAGNGDDGEAPTASPAGGEIEIATVPWEEGIAVASLWNTLLTEQGYEVEQTEFDEPALIYEDLADGDVDLFLDAWLPGTQGSFMDEHGERIDSLGSWNDGATVHLAVPDYVDIDSISEFSDQSDQFDNTIVGIDPGAPLSTLISESVIPEYGLYDVTLAESSAPAMLDELENAIEGGDWIVVALWRPHWAYDAYDLKNLDDPLGALGEGESLHALSGYGFDEDHPEVAGWLDSFYLDDEQIDELINLVIREYGEGQEAEAIEEWLSDPDNRELADSWIEGG